jgi:putative ABC transport system permease protein
VRINPEGGGVITVGEKSIQANDVMFADNAVFSVFTYKFIAGNPLNALVAPQTIVITRSLAETLFGDADAALGKTLYFENKFPNTVSAVIEDLPANSHIRFRGLRSLPAGYTAGWQAFELYTYILLKKGADVKNLEAKLPAFYKKHLEPSMGQGIDYRMELQPLSSIHLHSNLEYELAANGNMQYIYVFSIIGLLVLIIASINYMNLSTARASYRVKEIGVRKVIGSGKSQLVFMFLAESVLICLFAGGLAILIAELVMPLFNQLSGKELTIWRFGMPVTLLLLFAFTLITGLLSGIYPAFFMSGFLMIPSLKGQIGSRTGTTLFRKGLVTFQFVITIMMIAGSYIVYQQLNYIQNKNLGLNKDQVLTFHIDNQQLREKTTALKEAFLRNSLIESVSAASNPIGNNNIGSNGIFFEEESKVPGEPGSISATTRKTQNFMVDGDYLKTLEIGLIAGRNYSEQRKGDQASSILVNETLVKELGWKQPIGKRAKYYSVLRLLIGFAAATFIV